VDAAYTAARNAYLDHFEYVEIPLRVRDGGLTLEVEEDFAALRNLIEAGAPVGDVEATAAEVRRGLDRVERTLSAPGVAAPLIALFYAFTIVFREGLEAVLVVAAILAYLEASRNTQYRGAILKGVGGAVLATAATFVVTSLFLDIAPFQRELLEAGTALLAVAVLFYVSFWLVARLDHRRWMEFVKAKVWAAATTGSTLALAGVGFTAVYREGFETVLFYQALLSFAEGLSEWVALGALSGVAVLGVIGYVIFRAGKRVPIRTFLGTAVVLVMVMSVAFVGNAVRALQSAATISVTFFEGLPRLPIFLAELTGWYPTRETILAQAMLALVYIAGAMWMFVIVPRRERRIAAPPTATVDESVQPEAHSATTGS
ncbi:MAG: FTR1 family protein, partial [Actinomycetota bacterium]|nr:FTR1 family protein [Actinomycetota bacterium]